MKDNSRAAARDHLTFILSLYTMQYLKMCIILPSSSVNYALMNI